METENNNQEEKEWDLLSPKIDVVFHALFSETNNHLTEALLTDILKEKVRIIANLDRHMDISMAEEKLGVMDLRVELEDNTNCTVEIQIKQYKDEADRFLYYLADTYSRQLKAGEKYKELNKCISIIILNHEMKELKDAEELAVHFTMRDSATGRKILTNKFELVIIELPKARRFYEQNKTDKLSQWMMFIDNPNAQEVMDIMENNDAIKEAEKELKCVSGDYDLRRIAELKWKYIQEEGANKAYWEDVKNEVEGMRKEVEDKRKEVEDKQKEVEDKRKQIEEKGKQTALLETAKKLLKKGMTFSEITEITGINEEEIKK